jgi:hypothetical protein
MVALGGVVVHHSMAAAIKMAVQKLMLVVQVADCCAVHLQVVHAISKYVCVCVCVCYEHWVRW